MSETHYDIATVGGGLGGSSLAKVMSEHGQRVLVLEREMNFRDRVRGEFMTPWGVAEAKSLGIYELIRDNCGIDAQVSHLGFGPRDLPSTTPQQLPGLGFSHPEMQELLLKEAASAGAEVRRGVTVTGIKIGPTPAVTFQDENGEDKEVNARLVVGADGRTSSARKWAGFEVKEAPQPFYFAGLLLKGVAAPEDEVYLLFLPHLGSCTALTPVGRGRFRTYVAYCDDQGMRLQGEQNVKSFLADAKRADQVSNFFDEAEAIGPLASFRCGDFWVEHPFKDGVALIGDAGSTSDPAFGQGLATTARDVRVLRDCLLANDDWEAAGHAFATEHDRYSQVLRRVSHWYRSLFLEQGVDADARRARAMPLIAQDESRVPDHLFSGPDLPSDESVRRRFFGED